ncbi:MAG: dihydrofolate reductase [Bauldia sp.]
MSRPRIALIAAVARNGVIGAAGKMPWRLSTDAQRFKRLTMGKPIVMGRKTYESIGKPLPGRTNIVVTHRPGAATEGVVFVPDLEAALSVATTRAEVAGVGEIMVIGGGEIYAATLERADRLYITHVEASPDGDARFPPIDPAVWRGASSERIGVGEKDTAPTTFVIYDRVAPLPV